MLQTPAAEDLLWQLSEVVHIAKTQSARAARTQYGPKDLYRCESKLIQKRAWYHRWPHRSQVNAIASEKSWQKGSEAIQTTELLCCTLQLKLFVSFLKLWTCTDTWNQWPQPLQFLLVYRYGHPSVFNLPNVCWHETLGIKALSKPD